MVSNTLPDWVNEETRTIIRVALDDANGKTLFIVRVGDQQGVVLSDRSVFTDIDKGYHQSASALVSDAFRTTKEFEHATPSEIWCSWAGGRLKSFLSRGWVSVVTADRVLLRVWPEGSIYVGLEHPEVYEGNPAPKLVVFENLDNMYRVSTYMKLEMGE